MLMIIWIASYPKSGNTYIRSFLSAYYFSKKGKFNFDLLLNILQFPSLRFSKNNQSSFEDAAQNWIFNQNYFFSKNKFVFLKTHNTLKMFNEKNFTNSKQTAGAIYIVRDPRNIITSMCHHYSLSQEESYEKIMDKQSSLSEKSVDGDCSNFTFLSSWSEHYRSWKNSKDYKVLFIKYEDLQNNKEEIFKKIINFVNDLQDNKDPLNEKKFLNSINSTNFVSLKNKEHNEGFDEAVFSKDGKKLNFFNLGFKNKWQNFLSEDMVNKINNQLEKELLELDYI